MRLVLIRHGATEWSATGQHTGLTDIPLSDRGIEQATTMRASVAQLLETGPGPVRFVSSPLQRARLTAELATGGGLEVTTSDLLLEMNYGQYEGLTPPEVRAGTPGWDIWRDGCPDGETVEQVAERASRFFSGLDQDGTTLVFSHGHFIRILAAVRIGLLPAQGQIFTLDPATISIVTDVRGKQVVKLWNFDPSAPLS